jgi:hypothetical protein
MNYRMPLVLLPLVLGLAACVHTQEMPLAPNVVRLDTQASGLLFQGQAAPQTMKRAAELTLQNGYSHFRFEQASTQQGSQYAGSYTSGSATAYGSGGFATVNGSAISTPIYRPTSSVGVTVVMFHANEPGAQGAFDAKAVLKQYSQ